MLDNLVANTPITATTAGGIARGLLEIINEEFENILTSLDLNLVMSFVSTASGSFLDNIGELLNCQRETSESDDNYRYRITQQTSTMSKANETSIRLACLSVEGVKDVILRQFEKGAGTFTAYIITDSLTPSSTILDSVKVAINDVKAFGITAEIKALKIINVNAKLWLTLASGTMPAEQATIKYNAAQAGIKYLNNIISGETFSVSELIATVIKASTKIQNVEVAEIRIDGDLKPIKNYTIAWNERISSTIDIL